MSDLMMQGIVSIKKWQQIWGKGSDLLTQTEQSQLFRFCLKHNIKRAQIGGARAAQ